MAWKLRKKYLPEIFIKKNPKDKNVKDILKIWSIAVHHRIPSIKLSITCQTWRQQYPHTWAKLSTYLTLHMVPIKGRKPCVCSWPSRTDLSLYMSPTIHIYGINVWRERKHRHSYDLGIEVNSIHAATVEFERPINFTAYLVYGCFISNFCQS